MRVLLIFCCFLLAACDIAPPRDRQNAAVQEAEEQQADDQQAEENEADQHDDLDKAIRGPIEKAEHANDPVEQSDEAKRQAIDDQGG